MTVAKLTFSQKTQIELIKLLYRQLKFALWIESLGAISLVIALWGAINPSILIGWLIFNLVFCGLARHILIFYYQKSITELSLNYNNAVFWLILFGIGVLFSGISWGLAGTVLIVKNDIARETFLVFMLFGVTAIANVLYSANRIIYAIFLFSAFLPFSIWLMTQGNIYIILGLLAIIYIITMLALSFYSNELIYTSLFLRFENLDLVNSISLAKYELEQRTDALHRDINRRKFLEQKLFHQANFDLLTGLPNRGLIMVRIRDAIYRTKHTDMKVAVLFLDLDRFKIINDTLGHIVADKLLIAVAERLLKCIRSNDTVSREGGDEFLIVLQDLSNEREAINIAESILKSIQQPFVIDDRKFSISISIGISIYPKDATAPELLIRNADMAMYRAKELGRNNLQFFTEELNKRILNRLLIENQLRDALALNEFSLLYQPIVCMTSQRVIGLEALLKWNNPKLVNIPSSEFISIAEEAGLIIPIGEWALRAACMQTKIWHEAGFFPLQICVNFSARQFKQTNFLELMNQILKEIEFDPHFLTLEITESMLMEDVDQIIDILNQLKKIGITIVIDDFGKGYSSLNYLKRLPVDKLKIDRTFIQDIPQHQDDVAITKAVIALAEGLGLKVIAEGVENKSQCQFLVNHHCFEMQGYYFSRPLNVEDCTKLLREHKMQLPFNSIYT